MSISMVIQTQLLATKFYRPVISRNLISRPHLSTLLDESLKYPLTLISAPAGFGKTTLLATWIPSLPTNKPLVAWVSLDEEDNDPRLFWTYVLSALDQQQPERFTPLLKYLQSPQAPPLISILTALCNLILDSAQHFVLILDDYHVITEMQVHTTLSYLIEQLPPQFHIILATRTDSPLSLSLLRARQQVLEVRADQLRCTIEETRVFLHEVLDIQLSDAEAQQVTAHTEGWLVGLRLLGLSLPERADPLTLLQEISGQQRYILDFLTEVVLQRQSQEVQTFLLSTCILERLTASLCDAVMQQAGSQQMLELLEQANVFVVPLDHKRQWYRYHALFAEALRYLMEQRHDDLMPLLHHRASLWYAEHHQTTEAILHAFKAREWQWVADLIEQKSQQLMAFTWGASQHQLAILQHWVEQLPAEVMGSRPRLCLACTHLLWTVAPFPLMQAWLDAAQTMLTASLMTNGSQMILSSQVRQKQENLLGEVISWHALMQSFWEDKGQTALVLCQQALAVLSPDNFIARAHVALAQLLASYTSCVNDAVAAVKSGLQAISIAQAGHPVLAIDLIGSTAKFMLGQERLHEAYQLTQQAVQLEKKTGEAPLPDMGWPLACQAEILRKWNELDAALSLAQEAIELLQQKESLALLFFLYIGYAVLLRIHLSRGELEDACSVLREVERIDRSMNQPFSLHSRSYFTTIDQVRLWLACGELDRATHWAEKLDLKERHGTPLAREREEVARTRILLAKQQPTLALERLAPVLQRATAGQRWGHVIEMRLLQALAYQMHQEEKQALDTLSEAVRLAEPEGSICSFVDEGAPMEALLSRLRKRERKKSGPTPYLDILLATF